MKNIQIFIDGELNKAPNDCNSFEFEISNPNLIAEEQLNTVKQIHFEKTKELFSNLTNEQRFEIMNEYCIACGIQDKNCHCWNDI